MGFYYSWINFFSTANFFYGALADFSVEVILIYMLVLSFNPLFLILVFVIYLLYFVVLLIFLLSSYYYSYIVYLLFFSGLLVMFMYVCGIIFNEKIYFEFNFFFFFVISLSLIFLLGHFNFITLSVGGGVFYEFLGLLKFFLFSFNLVSCFFVFYLFLCLIVVYEVIKKNAGPLRMSSD